MRRVRALVSVVVLLVGLLALSPSAARADDPVFDPGPIAASPGCLGRSGASQYLEDYITKTDLFYVKQVWQGLSECDTQNLIQSLKRNYLDFGACALILEGVSNVPPAKPFASLGKFVCGAVAFGNTAFATNLDIADQNGGRCGVVVKYKVTFSVDMPGNIGGSVNVSDLQIVPRACRSGTQPKVSLVTGAGDIDWSAFDYPSLANLDAVVLDPVRLPDLTDPAWVQASPTTVTTGRCAPVTIAVPPVTGNGADAYAPSGVGDLSRLQYGTVDASAGPGAVTYTPDGSGNGTDVIPFTYSGPAQLASSVTVHVTGCAKLWIQFGLGGACVRDCDDPHYDTLVGVTMNVRMTKTLANSVYLTGNPWGGREEGNLQADAPAWNIRHVIVSDGSIRDTEFTVTYDETGTPVQVTYRYVVHDGSHVRATDWITTNQVI